MTLNILFFLPAILKSACYMRVAWIHTGTHVNSNDYTPSCSHFRRKEQFGRVLALSVYQVPWGRAAQENWIWHYQNAERGSVRGGERGEERNVRREMRTMLAKSSVSHSLAPLPPSGASSVYTDGLHYGKSLLCTRKVFSHCWFFCLH